MAKIARLHNISHVAFYFEIPQHAQLIRHDDTRFAIDFYYLYTLLTSMRKKFIAQGNTVIHGR